MRLDFACQKSVGWKRKSEITSKKLEQQCSRDVWNSILTCKWRLDDFLRLDFACPKRDELSQWEEKADRVRCKRSRWQKGSSSYEIGWHETLLRLMLRSIFEGSWNWNISWTRVKHNEKTLFSWFYYQQYRGVHSYPIFLKCAENDVQLRRISSNAFVLRNDLFFNQWHRRLERKNPRSQQETSKLWPSGYQYRYSTTELQETNRFSSRLLESKVQVLCDSHGLYWNSGILQL